jgi:hypothetical protein
MALAITLEGRTRQEIAAEALEAIERARGLVDSGVSPFLERLSDGSPSEELDGLIRDVEFVVSDGLGVAEVCIRELLESAAAA